MKLVLGVYEYPPHEYHYKYIDASWVLSDIKPRHPMIKQVDARDIQYDDIEAIYASHVLEHIYEYQLTLKHWHDKLVEGGYVHINVPDIEWALDNLMQINAGYGSRSPFYNSRTRMQNIFNGTMEDEFDIHKSWFNKDKLEQALIDAGFKNVSVYKEYEAHEMMCLIAKGYK